MRLVLLAAGRGLRLRAETGGRAKILLDVAGKTILDRAVELAAILGLEPLVVTRREHAAEIGRTAEVLVEEGEPSDIIETLYSARSALEETFCWMGGDMVFSDPPLPRPRAGSPPAASSRAPTSAGGSPCLPGCWRSSARSAAAMAPCWSAPRRSSSTTPPSPRTPSPASPACGRPSIRPAAFPPA